MKSSFPFPWRGLLGALALYSAIQAVFLGLASVAGSPEGREAQAIVSIVRDGTWFLPLRNGVVSSHPPLFHWIGAALVMLFGASSEVVVRLPSLLGAVGVLLCAALCAYSLALRGRTTESPLYAERAALLAAGVLSLTYGFHRLAVQAMVEMVFVLCIWGALTSLVFVGRSDDAPRVMVSPSARALFWIFCAAAVLAGGPLGLLLPLLLAFAGGIWLVGFSAAVRELFRPSLGWVSLGMPLAWYLAAYSEGGEALLGGLLLFPDAQTVLSGNSLSPPGWWFYLPSLLRTSFPWVVLMLGALVAMRPRGAGVSYRAENSVRILTLPFVVLLVGVVLLSLSSEKQPALLLPLLPLVAIQLGLSASWLVERGGLPLRQGIWVSARKAEALLCLACIGLLVFAGLGLQGEWQGDPVEAVVKFALGPFAARMGLVLLAALGVAVLVKKSRPWMLYGSVWALMVLLMTVVVGFGSVAKGALKGFPLMSEQLLLLSGPGKRVVFLKEGPDDYFDPLFFYMRRPVEIVTPGDGPLPCDSDAVYVARRELLEQLFHAIPGSLREMAVLQETLHALRRDGRREISVYSCTPGAFPDGRGEPAWFDAKLAKDSLSL